MKITRWNLVLLLLVTRIWAADANVAGLALPEKLFPQLEAILQSAVQQSPRMVNRALDLEIAENNRIQARANLLPSVGGWANYLEARDTRADLSGRLDVTKIGYNFSATQPLFHWGERRNNAKAGEIQAAIAKGQYRDAYRLLAQTLRADYQRLVIQKLYVQRAAFYLEYTRSQLAQAEDRLAKKVISQYEISGYRLAAEQAQIANEQTQYEFETAKASFARLSGTPQLADDAIPDSIPVPGYDAAALDGLLARFLGEKELPSVEAFTARKQLESQRLSLANTKTRLRPKLSFVVGVSQDDQSYTINVAQKYRVNSVFAGFSASWTLFDGFAAQAAVRNELARRRQLENDYRELTERLAQQAQTQVKHANFSARRMSIANRGLVASEATLKTKQEEFGRGLMSEADVSLARIALYDAQVNAYHGRIELLSRIGDFLGTLAEDPVVGNLPTLK